MKVEEDERWKSGSQEAMRTHNGRWESGSYIIVDSPLWGSRQ